MKKIQKILVFIPMFMIFLLAGCGMASDSGDGKANLAPLEQEFETRSFEKLALEDAPEALQKWIDANKATEQNKVFLMDGNTYVLSLLGEKDTNGYTVDITQIGEKTFIRNGEIDNINLSVSREVTEPEEEGALSRDKTYPLVIAMLPGEVDESFVFNTPLSETEVDGMFGDDTNPSDSNGTTSVTAGGGAEAEYVPTEMLMEDGSIKEE